MTTAIPTVEPDVIVAGDTVRWVKKLTDYLPADGWVLSYVFTSQAGVFSVVASDNGDGSHLASVTAADSAAYVPEAYRWQASVTKAAERHTVAWGATEVLPDYATYPPADVRTPAKQLLDAVEATLKGRATTDQASYSVGGVSIARLSMAELLQARSRLQGEVVREERVERIRKGLGHTGNILVRL